MPTFNPVLTGGNGTPTYNLGIAETYSWVPVQNDQNRPIYARATYNVGGTSFAKSTKDVVGKVKVSQSQNVYEADFEYGTQPLRWEALTTGTGTIQQLPQQGGVQMQINALGDVTVRQSRPYHRYQPGKSMFMASAVNFGGATAGQFQRVGFFDDANGIFFEQGTPSAGNPAGMSVVIRSDVGGLPIDTKFDYTVWSDPTGFRPFLDWTKLQMIWMEYAWYGAGCLRWGIISNGEPIILHEAGQGNVNPSTWCRTGNLPVRYEQRNIGANTPNTMIHYGVSVIVEGGRDVQRGFTYSYGMSGATTVAANAVRKPILSIRNRTMGTTVVDVPAAGAGLSAISTVTTPFGVGGPVVLTLAGTAYSQFASLSGYQIYFPSLSGNGFINGATGRIYASAANSLTCVDVVVGLSSTASGRVPLPLSGITVYNSLTNSTSSVIPAVGAPYKIGLINRGQILPLDLLISTTNSALFEFYVSTPTNPIVLNTPRWDTLASLSSYNSFAERDIIATSFTGGENVYAFFTSPGNNIQDKDLSNFFPLYNTVRGNQPDVLTLAVTQQGGVSNTIGANFICQEAMS